MRFWSICFLVMTLVAGLLPTAHAKVIAVHAGMVAKERYPLCQKLTYLRVRTPSAKPFAENQEDLSKLIAAIRAAALFECGANQPEKINLQGYRDGKLTYEGAVSAVNNWTLPPMISSYSARGRASGPTAVVQSQEAGDYQEQFRYVPSGYPAYCAQQAKNITQMPKLQRIEGYQSEREPVINYTQSDGTELIDNTSNAFQSLGAMTGYATAMKNAYEDAAKAFWDSYDRTGQVDPGKQMEYAYWIWRRERFEGEISQLSPGLGGQAGGLKFLSNTLSGIFYSPARVDTLEHAVAYDYYKYGRCQPKRDPNIDNAIAYERFLDLVPHNTADLAAELPWLNLSAFSQQEKEDLVFVMRRNRAEQNRLSYGSSVRREEDARRELAKLADPTPPALEDFLSTHKAPLDQVRAGRLDTRISIPAAVSSYSGQGEGSPRYVTNVLTYIFLHQYAGGFPDGVTAQTMRNWIDQRGPAPAIFSARDVSQARSCATDLFKEAAQFLYEQNESLFQSMSLKKQFGQEYCTTARKDSMREGPITMGRDRASLACVANDAYRIAFMACLADEPIGFPREITESIVWRYQK